MYFYRTVVRAVALLAMAAGLGLVSLRAAPSTDQSPVIQLKLDDYLQQVVAHNESIQVQMLETEVSRHKARGERGIFEPEFEASVTLEANRRTNNVQQQAAASGSDLFDERNNIYDGGLESLVPTGGKIRLGYTLSDLANNVNPNPLAGLFGQTNSVFTRQYQTFVGVTFTQPLLKNAGFTPTLANIRLAALDSDIAFEQYRQQLMLTIFRAEAAYWGLYFAQEQIHFFADSVSVAQTVLDDSEEKLKAGQGAELDVMESQSALALRRTKQNDALQNYYESLGHLQNFSGTFPQPMFPASKAVPVRAVDDPHTTNAPLAYVDSFQNAFSFNPDYLIQQKKLNQEKVRLGVAKNQLLPELDLKAAYGYNGLGLTPGDSWAVAASQDFPSWSVGVMLTVPLAGNIKGRNLFSAAGISLQQAFVNLKGVQNEIANGLNTAIQKAQGWQQSIQNYETVVHYNEELLKTQVERLKAGRVEARKVLEVEADLLDSRQELANALVQYQRALLEVELTDGSILKNRNLDLTREELRRETTALLKDLHATPDEFRF